MQCDIILDKLQNKGDCKHDPDTVKAEWIAHWNRAHK